MKIKVISINMKRKKNRKKETKLQKKLTIILIVVFKITTIKYCDSYKSFS